MTGEEMRIPDKIWHWILLPVLWWAVFTAAVLERQIDGWVWSLTEPNPFGNVKVIWQQEDIAGNIEFVAVFTKYPGCRLLRFSIVADGARSEPRYLQFIDMDGHAEDFDRDPGAQALRIRILTQQTKWERITLRTRHDCDGDGPRITQRVFATIYPDVAIDRQYAHDRPIGVENQ